jgi:hypothetical protein
MLAAMHETARMAGFLAAHGILSVSDGETLIPILGYQEPDGGRVLERLIFEDVADGARAGQQALRANDRGAVRAVLVVDGYVHLERGRTDALIVEAAEYGPVPRSLTLAVPYRPKPGPRGFAVYRPKFIEIVGLDERDQPSLGDAFFAGVDSHKEAAAVWNAHLDQSI